MELAAHIVDPSQYASHLRRTLEAELIGDTICYHEITGSSNAVHPCVQCLLGPHIGPVLLRALAGRY
jgi:hypothetical protein